MHKFTELETVVLTHDIEEHGLREGDMGAVVNVYGNGEAGEVEFVTATGITNSVLAIGNHSIQNRTSGQEHIFVCLIDVPMGLNAQSYSTLELGAWTLDII